MAFDGIKIAALWEKEKNGTTFLSGPLSTTSRLLIYPNKNRKGERDPTHIVYIMPVERQKPGEGQQQERERPSAPALGERIEGSTRERPSRPVSGGR